MKVHNFLGEMVDTVCFILVLIGTLFLFTYYWNDSYCLEYAEHVTESFFDEAERLQEITAESYVALVGRIRKMNSEFDVNLQIKRGNQLLLSEDIQTVLVQGEAIRLQAGDFLTATISKGSKQRSVLFAVIWW